MIQQGTRSFLAALFLSCLVVLAAFSAVGATGRIGARPALPREDEPRSSSIFIHTLKLGETVSDKALISNSSATTQTAVLYVVDAIPANTGAFTCKQRAEKTTDAGGWVKLARSEVTLKPGATELVDFTITAPRTADVGEHNACLAIETKDDAGEVSGNLRIRTRSAIRIALTIPGALRREVQLESFSVVQDENLHQRYNLTLKNTGNVSADTDVLVRLKSLFGETVYENKGQYPVLAGNKLELSFDNKKTPFFGGWYLAEASAQYDKNAERWGTTTVTDIATVKAPTQSVFLWPQPLGLAVMIAGIAAIAAAILYPLRERAKRRGALKSWSKFIIDEGDTLHSLAKQSGISWKQIVKVNRIKPPYGLKPGSSIYLPDKPVTKKTKKKRS